MNLFLGATSFPAPSLSVKTAGCSFVGQATFNGCIVFTNWLRDDVARLLPADFDLAANTSSTPDLHPLVFIFGEQTEGATIFGGFTVPMGIRYHEFAMAIPFVKHRHGRYLHSYIPRMYSGYFPATWSGNAHYGLSKEMGKMWWQGSSFVLTTDDDTLLLHATVETEQNWSVGCPCNLLNFKAMQEVFALPIVGRKSNGAYVCSYFDWDFTGALVRPADSCVSIDAPFLEGLTPGQYRDVPSGTFEVRRMIWRLSWPGSCRFC